MCLSHWYAVSRAYGCTLIPFHQPSWPQIREFRVTCGVNIMTNHHVWGWYPSQTITSNIHIVYTKKCLRHWYAISRAYVCILIPFHRPSWSQIWEVGVTCGMNIMPCHHAWGWYYNVFETLACCLKGIWRHSYTIPLAKLIPDLGIQGHLLMKSK